MFRPVRYLCALLMAFVVLTELPVWAAELTWYGSLAADNRRAVMEAALAAAPTHGLNFAMAAPTAADGDIDAQFNAMAQRYVAALAGGVVNPAALGKDWAIPLPGIDAATILADAISNDNLPTFLNTLAPPDPQYRRLMDALARYRDMAQRGGWPGLDVGVATFDKSPSQALLLRTRLAAEGYVIRDDTDLATAVRAFQFSHDLDVDGRIGPRTLMELNTPVTARVTQIAVNLERWRVLPHDIEARRIVVNVPAARLDVVDGDQIVSQMRVIDGDSKHPTPSFIARISAVTLNPAWTVPVSIARKEILPQLKRHPSYLADHNITILDRDEDPFGKAIDWRNYRVGYFPFRLRQQPGPNNSLGAVKFEMADPFDVYLHDTSSKALFARAIRSLSHGCVRVERPDELAALLLGAKDSNDIGAAIADGSTRTLRLPRPISVYIVYLTATVDENQEVNFHPDVYGRDPAIAEALGFTRREREVLALGRADTADTCV